MLIGNYPKMKNSLLSLYFLKKYMRLLKENCKDNASNLKKTTKIRLNLTRSY